MRACLVVAILAFVTAQMPAANAQTVTLRCDPTSDQKGSGSIVVTIDESKNMVYFGGDNNSGWYRNQRSWTADASSLDLAAPDAPDPGGNCIYTFTQFVRMTGESVFFGLNKQLAKPCAAARGLLTQDILYYNAIDRLLGDARFDVQAETETFSDGQARTDKSVALGSNFQCQ
jgi:hypothetical protein